MALIARKQISPGPPFSKRGDKRFKGLAGVFGAAKRISLDSLFFKADRRAFRRADASGHGLAEGALLLAAPHQSQPPPPSTFFQICFADVGFPVDFGFGRA